MAKTPPEILFEAPNGDRYWIRRVMPRKRKPGIASAWPPDGWLCAPEGQKRNLNATRPTALDAIAHATGIGVDQPWTVKTARDIEARA